MIGFGDPERLIIIVLLIISIIFILREPRYVRVVKALKIIPRIYLLAYYTMLVTDIYVSTWLTALIRTGIGSVYGVLLLLIVEVYLQWANLIYGRR